MPSHWENALQNLPTAACQAVYGETVSYAQDGEDVATITAMFFEDFDLVEFNGETEVGVSSTAPVFDIRLADLPFRPKKGDLITRDNAAVYKVVDPPQTDSNGQAKLICKKVAA